MAVREQGSLSCRQDIIFVDPKNPDHVVIVEIKNTDWDKVKHPKKLVGSHRRQLWKYIDPYQRMARPSSPDSSTRGSYRTRSV